MYQPRTKRAERRRLLLTYTLVPLFIGAVVALLVFYMLGWRFSLTDHTVSQGGLLQFASQPTGATITVDTYELPSKTNTRYDAAAGLHTITMRQNGYIPWQKTVTLQPGKVLWLNYARLIPEKITHDSLVSYAKLSRSLASTTGQIVLTLPHADKAELQRIELGDTVRPETVAIPDSLLKTNVKNSRFNLASISKSGRYAIIEHTYTKGHEWLLIDTESVNNSQNITTIIGGDSELPIFSTADPRKLYTLVNHDVRLVDASALTLSAPIISNVAEFNQSAQGTLAYVSRVNGSPSQRTAGYYVPGDQKPYVVRTFYDDGKATLRFLIGSFGAKTYFAMQYGTTIEINSTRSLIHTTDDQLQLASVATLAVPNDTDSIVFSPGGRFIMAQRAATYLTYDLELNSLATTSLKGPADSRQALGWLDQYIVWSDRDDTLRLYEFDGANTSAIGNVVQNQAVVLSSNNEYIYAFQKPSNSDAAQLVRFHLRAN